MDERAQNKRKLREMQQQEATEEDWEDYEPVAGVEAEKPGEGLKLAAENNKKQKLDDDEAEKAPAVEDTPSKLSKKEEKKAAKKEKKEKKEKKKDSKVEKTKTAEDSHADDTTEAAPTPKSQKQANKKQAKSPAAKKSKPVVEEEEEEAVSQDKSEVQPMDIDGLEKDDINASSNSDSEPHSPTFDTADSTAPNADLASATTSVSSTITPSEKPKQIKVPADTSALKARLAAKIEALRAARKADGPDGKPIRTRQELIESRRHKQALRKERKQELRKQAKLDEQKKREEALASNSPSVMSPTVELDNPTGSFAFGRVAFGDGTQLSHDLSYVLNQGKKKGPSDPKTALLKVQNQKKRLEELDEEKRKDIVEKDSWLNARRRVEGEKIRDDETLLKKAVKRKEADKRKSEKAWQERSSGVKLAQKQKQKKREENLKKRREEKGGKGKKKKGGVTKKKGGRPGFEGSLGVGGKRK